MQIFRRPGSKEISTSKMWFHIVNVLVSFIYYKVGLAVAASAEPDLEGLALLTFAYVGLITGNKLASVFLKARYGTNTNTQHQNMAVDSGSDQSYRPRDMGL